MAMQNVALGKPALQSSTSPWSTSPIAAEDARRANNGVFTGKEIFHTGRQLNPWWQVDLQEDFVVGSVAIFNWRPTAERLKNFSVLGSRDGQSWRVLFRKKDDVVFGSRDEAPFVCEIAARRLSRFLRIRLDGRNYLNFNECQVFGVRPDATLHERLIREEEQARHLRFAIPDGRVGYVSEIDDFAVFVDTKTYSQPLVQALKVGTYEAREREVLNIGLRHDDRVLEAGTAIGVVTMAAAGIVDPANIVTFDANPAMVADASANFRRNGMHGIDARLGLLRNRSATNGQNETMPFHISRDFVSSRLTGTGTDHDILNTVQVQVYCLEDEIRTHRANFLLLDIEGAEVDLFLGADLTGIRAIVLETHYHFAGEAATDAMIRDFYTAGFRLHLGASGNHVLLLRR